MVIVLEVNILYFQVAENVLENENVESREKKQHVPWKESLPNVLNESTDWVGAQSYISVTWKRCIGIFDDNTRFRNYTYKICKYMQEIIDALLMDSDIRYSRIQSDLFMFHPKQFWIRFGFKFFGYIIYLKIVGSNIELWWSKPYSIRISYIL